MGIVEVDFTVVGSPVVAEALGAVIRCPIETSRRAKPRNAIVRDNMQGTDDAYYRGVDNLLEGRFAVAVADFTQAIELDPQRANAYRLRGIAYNNTGEEASAEADYKKAEQLGLPGKP